MGAEGLTELKRHAFFGGSLAAFSEVLQCKPPKRVDRLQRGLASESSFMELCEDIPHSSDWSSSAECTPEIGQSFAARCQEGIPVSAPTEHTAKFSFAMLKQKLENFSPRSHYSSHQELNSFSARSGCSSSSRRASPTLPPLPEFLVASARSQRARSPRFDDTPSNRRKSRGEVQPSSNCRWLRPDKPFLSWPQWLRQLVNAGTLHEEEGVVICGSVVRRLLPCLRPKVLMLTDTPRLLLLDSSGLRLVSEIPLIGRDAGYVVAKSMSDFELRTPRDRYLCYELHRAEEWKGKIDAAIENISLLQS